ncbi:MAG: PrsW family glutamic-type intramembrane protease, partial [Patescibacteria group bacterium]
PVWLLFLWAATEEVFKFAAAYWAALRLPIFNEPIEAPIYLITAALGFAAMENSIFIFKIISSYQNTEIGILTGQLRFLGAMLLHVTTSGIVGASIAFSFFHREHRHRNIIGGILTATLLHALFNYFILESGGENVLSVFLFVWIITIAFIFLLERIKKLKPESTGNSQQPTGKQTF